MTIRDSLQNVAQAIEELQNKPVPRVEITDRELSGNKIHGGRITQFSSQGIQDNATTQILRVEEDGVHINVVHANTLKGPVSVDGNLNVSGEIHATKLYVDEIQADVRNKRSEPLSFTNDNGDVAYGKGLIWPGGEYTKQFVLQQRPDRFFSTESIEVAADKHFMVGQQEVLNNTTLGTSVVNSSLRTLGTLSTLTVEGPLNVDDFLMYDASMQRLGIGTDEPNGVLAIENFDNEFIVDSNNENEFVIGAYTNTSVNIITDNTERLTVTQTGTLIVRNKAIFKGKIGVGVTNFTEDADITTAGPVRFQNKKFEVADSMPGSGHYNKGDIVWNSEPSPTGHVGWVCIKTGTPGEWKTFGSISS
jgi:hypothetical protein